MTHEELLLGRQKPRAVLSRTIAVGICPHCNVYSVEISQAAADWEDPDAKTTPTEWAPLQMECICGATIDDVELPLDPRRWQMFITIRAAAQHEFTPEVIGALATKKSVDCRRKKGEKHARPVLRKSERDISRSAKAETPARCSAPASVANSEGTIRPKGYHKSTRRRRLRAR